MQRGRFVIEWHHAAHCIIEESESEISLANWRNKPELFAWSEPELAPNELTLEPSIVQDLVATTQSVSNAVLISAFAAGAFFVHLFAANGYGYFRDELYYAACGQHLAWGYVDHAPLIAAICWFARRLLGDSLYALRFFPALSAAAKVLLTAWMVREFGGRRFAYLLACIAFNLKRSLKLVAA